MIIVVADDYNDSYCCVCQILKKRNVDISGAGMSEDGLSPLEETLASYMQV